MKKYILPAMAITLIALLALTLIACNDDKNPSGDKESSSAESATDAPTDPVTDTPTEPTTDPATDEVTDPATEPATETETEPETESETEPETEDPSLHLGKLDSLREIMEPIFSGNVVSNETVMFLDPGDAKQLLYTIDEIISVTSYDQKTVYEQGKDYDVVDGKLVLLEGSAIPHIGSETFYNYPGSIIQVNHDGKTVLMYWGEATAMTKWQICVNYTHADTWSGFYQTCEASVYTAFIEKLKNGENVTVMFYGDSITYGANASFLVGGGTNQHTYSQMFVEALADVFDYKVHYINPGLGNTAKVPDDYGTGERGTITYINTGVGGWTSMDGVNNFNNYVKAFVEQYGCDLFFVAYGMNDGGNAPSFTAKNTEKILNGVLELAPDCALCMIATMVPNPAGIGWYGNQAKQEAALIKSAEKYRENGVACAVACMGSTSLAVLEHKEFMDYTGNNVNHPNDFFGRVYAQTIFETVIGYENLD